jgi:hypothetical protein
MAEALGDDLGMDAGPQRDTCSHAIPAMHEEAEALIAGLVFVNA